MRAVDLEAQSVTHQINKHGALQWTCPFFINISFVRMRLEGHGINSLKLRFPRACLWAADISICIALSIKGSSAWMFGLMQHGFNSNVNMTTSWPRRHRRQLQHGDDYHFDFMLILRNMKQMAPVKFKLNRNGTRSRKLELGGGDHHF